MARLGADPLEIVVAVGAALSKGDAVIDLSFAAVRDSAADLARIHIANRDPLVARLKRSPSKAQMCRRRATCEGDAVDLAHPGERNVPNG